ncbi:MAG: type II toxin-antitoxin system VapC family toxin [Acuticoccus sp.]
MKLLLDTHAALWWLAGDDQLSDTAARLIADPDNVVLASAVSGYEIELKIRRWRLTTAVAREFALFLDKAAIPALPLDLAHMTAGAALDWEHHDPWDRLLASQARLEGATLVSIDAAFDEIDGFKRAW